MELKSSDSHFNHFYLLSHLAYLSITVKVIKMIGFLPQHLLKEAYFCNHIFAAFVWILILKWTHSCKGLRGEHRLKKNHQENRLGTSTCNLIFYNKQEIFIRNKKMQLLLSHLILKEAENWM